MGNIGSLSASVFLLSFLLYWFKIRIRVPKGYKLPPGPPKHFLFGNLFNIPLEKEWQRYHTWFKLYGDLTHLSICGTSILFVNSYKSVSELFEQRGAIYSGRFGSTMVADIAGFNWSLAMMQPNEEWRKHRSILHRYLSKPSMTKSQPLFEKYSINLLQRLYQTPDKFVDHTRHLIGAFIMELTYGIQTLPDNDPYIELAESALKLLGEISAPGAYLVDIIPILKHIPSWVPGAGFKRKAERLKAELTAMSTVPFNVVKSAMKAGNAPPSIVGSLLEEMECAETAVITDETAIRSIGAVMYMAGIDTTESTLQVFFMVMLLYPEVQRKAQEELDRIVGGNTFVSFDDRKSLPYIEALIKEVLRWHPVLPFAFPHLLKEDDIIGEYFVPKGTIVVGNGWSLFHTESEYGDDVDEFRPERFLKPGVKYPDNAYGFGRRVCPGRQLVDTFLFIIIANVLHTFDISPYETSLGPELPNPNEFGFGVISRPKPFKCKITPRSFQTKVFLDQLSGIE